MMCAVRVTPDNGRFRAAVVGAPEMNAGGATRDEAVAALRATLDAEASNGEIVWIDVPAARPAPLAVEWTAEMVAEMNAIVEDIYREREAQKKAEYPE